MAQAAINYHMRRLTSQWLKHQHDPVLHRSVATVKTGTYSLLVPKVLFSGDNGFSTDTVSTKEIPTGTVMGRITVGSATSAAKSGGNTGNGTCTVDGTTPVLAGAIPGVYTVRCIDTDTNLGVFQVRDPNGVVIGVHSVGATAFATQIKFVLADGATDFVVGDGFDITVAAGSNKVVPCKYGAVDGSAVPVGFLFNGVDTTDGDAPGVLIDGFAEVVPLELVWDDSFDSSGKIAAALAVLAKSNIKTVRVA